MRHSLFIAPLLVLAPAAFATGQAAPQTHTERKFDASGQLTELTLYDYSAEPPLVERLTIRRNEAPWAELRVRTTERSKVVLRRETEMYKRPGQIDEREIVWSSRDNAVLDRRTVMRYLKKETEVSDYAAKPNKEWQLLRTARHPKD